MDLRDSADFTLDARDVHPDDSAFDLQAGIAASLAKLPARITVDILGRWIMPEVRGEWNRWTWLARAAGWTPIADGLRVSYEAETE